MKCVVMKLDTCIAARIGSNILFGNHRASNSVVSIIQAGAPNNHALDIYSLCGVTPVLRVIISQTQSSPRWYSLLLQLAGLTFQVLHNCGGWGRGHC